VSIRPNPYNPWEISVQIRLTRGKNKKNRSKIWSDKKKAVILQWVSPTRPAPSELPQSLTAARVGGRSGAM